MFSNSKEKEEEEEEKERKHRRFCHESIGIVERRTRRKVVSRRGMCTSICVLEQNSTELFQNKLINAN